MACEHVFVTESYVFTLEYVVATNSYAQSYYQTG